MKLAQLEHFSSFDRFYDGRDQLKWHIYERSERAFASGAKARESLAAIEEILERQKQIRELILKSIGDLPSSLSPLKPQITGCVEGEGFRVEKIIFQSRPYNYVTANLYVPENLTEPRGAVLFLCGHHQQAKHNSSGAPLPGRRAESCLEPPPSTKRTRNAFRNAKVSRLPSLLWNETCSLKIGCETA